MRKRVIGSEAPGGSQDAGGWLDLEPIAQVEITSEEPDHPIEAALRALPGGGWRAAAAGPQTIRLVFDQPQRLRRIRLVFQEDMHTRTQEFVLRWSQDAGRSYEEVLRQQYTFSPPGTAREVEDYQVDLGDVTVFEVQIIPDVSRGPARASLAALQLA